MHIGLRELGAPIWVRIDVAEVGIVLQIALARLVARGAVERVIDEVHLQDELPRIFDRLGVGEDLHSFAERCRARLDQTAALAKNFDSTDATRSPWAQQWLITKVRNLDVRHPRGFENRGPSGTVTSWPLIFPVTILVSARPAIRSILASIFLVSIPRNTSGIGLEYPFFPSGFGRSESRSSELFPHGRDSTIATLHSGG